MKRLLVLLCVVVVVLGIPTSVALAQWEEQPKVRIPVYCTYWQMLVEPGWTSPYSQLVGGEIKVLTKEGTLLYWGSYEFVLPPGWGLEGTFGLPFNICEYDVKLYIHGWVEGPEGGAGWAGLLERVNNSGKEDTLGLTWNIPETNVFYVNRVQNSPYRPLPALRPLPILDEGR